MAKKSGTGRGGGTTELAAITCMLAETYLRASNCLARGKAFSAAVDLREAADRLENYAIARATLKSARKAVRS